MRIGGLIFGFVMVALPGLCFATNDLHAGQTQVMRPGIPGPVWLTQAEIEGAPLWRVKVKCFNGDKIVSETDLEILDGYAGRAYGTSRRGNWNPWTGQTTYRTRLKTLIFADATRPGNSHWSLDDEAYQPVLDQTQPYSLGYLKLHVYCDGADHFTAEVFTGLSAGYTIDDSQPLPVATARDAVPETTLVGTLNGVLQPREAPLYFDPPIHYAARTGECN